MTEAEYDLRSSKEESMGQESAQNELTGGCVLSKVDQYKNKYNLHSGNDRGRRTTMSQVKLEDEKKRVQCKYCKYNWDTKTKFFIMSCPCCGSKVRIRETE